MAKKGNLLVKTESGEFQGFFEGEFIKIDKDGKFMVCRDIKVPMNEKGIIALAEAIKQVRGY